MTRFGLTGPEYQAQSVEEQAALESLVGWWGSGCPCDGCALRRRDFLVEIRRRLADTPEP